MKTRRSDIADRIRRVEDADTDNFLELVRIAELDPAFHFCFANLESANFDDLQLAGFDFTGARMSGCSFRGTDIEGADFTDAILDPGALYDHRPPFSSPNDSVHKSQVISMPDTQTILVSCTQADRAWAEWIAWEIEEHGFKAAWDFRGNFVLEMDQATREAQKTIAVLSQDYVDAEFTHPEWAEAFAQDPTGEQDKLIPVRIGDVKLEGPLARISYVDFVGKDEDTARDLLIARVKGLRGKPSEQPDFPGKLANN